MSIPVYCFAGYKAGSKPSRMSDEHLGGQLFRGLFQRRDVLYPNYSPSLANATIGAEMAYEMAAKPGRKILFGFSMGSRAIQLMLRGNPALDPDNVVVVLAGNQERKYGGISATPGSGWPADYGGPGLPEDCPIRVFDVARQYEFFTDYPNVLPNTKAVLNALSGIGLHGDYSNVRIGDPNNAVHVEGNTTYILSPTFPMPSCRSVWWSPQREALEDGKARQAVEKGYTRPCTVQAQTIKWYKGGGGVDTKTGRTVRQPSIASWNPFA